MQIRLHFRSIGSYPFESTVSIQNLRRSKSNFQHSVLNGIRYGSAMIAYLNSNKLQLGSSKAPVHSVYWTLFDTFRVVQIHTGAFYFAWESLGIN